MPSIVNVSASWYEIDDDELATDQTDDEVPDAISFMSMVFIGKFLKDIFSIKSINSMMATKKNICLINFPHSEKQMHKYIKNEGKKS